MKNQWVEGIVVGKRQWKDNLYSLNFEAPMGDFQAGQFTQLALDIDGDRVARPYSLVNPPHHQPMEVYLNVVDDGPLSSRLCDLKTGDRIWVTEQANGFFTVNELPASRDLWLLATGTALGVYLSILRTERPWERFQNIILVHGVRYADELSYGEEIAALLKRYPKRFRILRTVSRERVSGHLHGRITDLLLNGSLEHSAGLALRPQDSHLMLCGNMEMIRDVTKLLEARGLHRHRREQPGHYTTEKYH
jgi:ferredoxin--NADP+ reductase